MPILRIVSDSKTPYDHVEAIKGLGAKLGYDDPRKIWVETSSDLTQPDVMYVTVTVVEQDFAHPQFEKFCFHIANYLRMVTRKSVEVVHPTNTGIHSVCWCPTEEGAQVYGGGQ